MAHTSSQNLGHTHKPDIRLLVTSEVILRGMRCGKAFWLCEFNKLWTSQLSEVTQCLSRRLPIDTVTRLLLAINQLLTCLSQDKERLRKAVLSRVQATLNWSWGLWTAMGSATAFREMERLFGVGHGSNENYSFFFLSFFPWSSRLVSSRLVSSRLVSSRRLRHLCIKK